MGFAESTLVGEAFVGEGANAAHINAILGRKGGPVETAWATALAAPDSETHGEMTWGPAQAGVAAGMAAAVEESLIPRDEVRNLLCILTVWVNPEADEADAVYEHNRSAAHDAIQAAVNETPAVEDVLQYLGTPANPFYDAGR